MSKFRKNGFFGNAKVAIIPVFEHCRQIEMPEPIDVEEYELCAGILKKVNEIERREHTLVNPVSGEKIIKITREDVSFGEKAINRIIEIELEKHPDWNISQSNDESLPIQK